MSDATMGRQPDKEQLYDKRKSLRKNNYGNERVKEAPKLHFV